MHRNMRLICLGLAAALAFSTAAPSLGQETSKTINWLETKIVELDEKSRKDSTIFQDFEVLSGKKHKEPIMIYFYRPKPKEDEKKKPKKSLLKQIALCEQMEKKLFKDASFIETCQEFICVKVNLKEFPKQLSKKYRAKKAPLILMFDCTGKKVGKINKPNPNIIHILIVLRDIIARSNAKKEGNK